MDDWVRYYNLACCLAIAIAGAPQLFGKNGFLTRGGKDQLHWQSSILLNLTAGWGTIESLRGHYDGGFRVYFLSIGLTWLLVTVLYRPLEKWHDRHPAPSDGTITGDPRRSPR